MYVIKKNEKKFEILNILRKTLVKINLYLE